MNLGEYEENYHCIMKSNGDNTSVTIVAEYENRKLNVTANYNLDMNLIGLYIK